MKLYFLLDYYDDYGVSLEKVRMNIYSQANYTIKKSL